MLNSLVDIFKQTYRAAKCLLKYCIYNYFTMENKASSKDCFVESVKWLFRSLVLRHAYRITYPHQIKLMWYPIIHIWTYLALIELAKFLSLSEMATSAYRLALIPIHWKLIRSISVDQVPHRYLDAFPNSLSYNNESQDSFQIMQSCYEWVEFFVCQFCKESILLYLPLMTLQSLIWWDWVDFYFT